MFHDRLPAAPVPQTSCKTPRRDQSHADHRHFERSRHMPLFIGTFVFSEPGKSCHGNATESFPATSSHKSTRRDQPVIGVACRVVRGNEVTRSVESVCRCSSLCCVAGAVERSVDDEDINHIAGSPAARASLETSHHGIPSRHPDSHAARATVQLPVSLTAYRQLAACLLRSKIFAHS